MVQNLLKATVVTALVVALSQIFSFSIRLASGQPFTAFVFLMNSIMPVLTGFPISLYIFIQNAKLKKTTDELTEANRLLQIRADTDSMTGLLNRNAFLGTIKQLNKSSRLSALLVIDADNFKKINDIYGHQAGDKALTAIVDALRLPLRQCDIIGRIGGEEFAVFLPDTDINPALKIAEQLRCAVESIEFHPAEEQDYQLSISIGLAFSAGAHTTSQLMRMADQSLYQAKANGRNQIVINQESLTSNTKSLDSMDAA
ncbi:GGDEF domain-containing protein [Bacillus subtilis]|uniref:GGDEF domain-containing protein n=1 Tax=Pseudochrobactrum asaccharolyticum TaxID=354351 RepID=UPI001F38712C|nr:GGDEF domain-containing protein [Pseudochrobactrum asaccharolyticum]MCF7644922.1 GGDEF domain-containing protein [Pseudochrobactrum asaccharolyticum]MCF7671650.1 GGDEF domain-containing protein [Bacillus subtilis]